MMKAGKPFYSMSEIGDYTFAPWKVVWREQASSMTASVAGPSNGDPIVPDHKCMLVECKSSAEAHYVCAVLNSRLTVAAVLGYAVEIQMDPHILEHIRIPRFDRGNSTHQRLTDLSFEAHETARRGETLIGTRIEAEIDQHSVKLWGLTRNDLREIHASLEDLVAPETAAGESGAES